MFVILAQANGLPAYTCGIYSTLENAREGVYKEFGRKLVKPADENLLATSQSEEVEQYTALHTLISIIEHQVDY